MKTHLDLFSGIGGFALAARWSGFETVQFVEIEPYAQKVLAKNFPGVPIHDDIKTFSANEFYGVGLLTGGYPCQPFSQAGKRRGKEDDRHLWPEMFRVIQECRPTWVLAENVSGHIKLGVEEVLTDLESAGYQSQVFHIGAVAKDAPHRRMRLWIVAWNTNSDNQIQIESFCRGENTESSGVCKGTSDSGDVAYSKSKGSRRAGKSRISKSEQSGVDNYKEGDRSEIRSNSTGCSEQNAEDVTYSDSKRGCLRETNREDAEDVGEPSRCEEHWGRITQPRLGGTLSDGVSLWMDEPDIPRVGVGIPDRAKRLKAIGNAIVPAVAYEIMRLMK